ncbi:MAG: hypothetical protein M1829_000684 [Trizodia sp. TS-e1964]|nr:MAG: hypothetical protein M1829_000684 [Trizodia sp. TS-e1964]
MDYGKILEGVFGNYTSIPQLKGASQLTFLAINKPPAISSAQVLRDLQSHFNPSKRFAPWLLFESNRLEREARRPRRRGPLQVKIGHGGTLDPLATGVLIAGIGKGTKELQSFLECSKTYEATLLFGAATDTYDIEGKILKRADYSHITREMVEAALAKFRGAYKQTPPIFSAIRVGGKHLYEYAREGKKPPTEIAERDVHVYNLEIVDWFEGGQHDFQWPTLEAEKAYQDIAEETLPRPSTISRKNTTTGPRDRKRKIEASDDAVFSDGSNKRTSKKIKPEDAEETGAINSSASTPEAAIAELAPRQEPDQAETPPPPPPSAKPNPPAVKLRLTVSSGFYVRSLCHDLGIAVGSLGLMSSLVRTRQGQFELGTNVFEYDLLAKGEEVWGPIVESMLDDWTAKKAAAQSIMHSGAIAPNPVVKPGSADPTSAVGSGVGADSRTVAGGNTAADLVQEAELDNTKDTTPAAAAAAADAT